MRIVHISPSALAGAPSMLSNALEDYNLVDFSVHFRCGDFAAERGLVAPDSITLGQDIQSEELFAKSYLEADLIHVHNFIPRFVLSWIAKLGVRKKVFVYQVHSPRFERPVFADMSHQQGVHFESRFVVGHFHPRQYPDFEIVPNCLYRRRTRFPLPASNNAGETVVFFSPSGNAKGRFSTKSSPEFEAGLSYLAQQDGIRVERFTQLPPEKLAAMRSRSHITIDELITGGYHLVSYEGLAAGTVVLNNADDLAIASFCAAFHAPEPPFLRTAPKDLVTRVLALRYEPEQFEAFRNQSREFFERWMSPHRVANLYMKKYERLF